MKHPRTLREPILRAFLYYRAKGRCECCGEPLVRFHADHVVPWRTAKRTNVYEMQALCAACNLKKG